MVVKQVKMSSNTTASNTLPLTVVFDDLMRHYDLLVQHDTTPEFLAFAINQEECREKWNNAEEECKRLQQEIQNKDGDLAAASKKIQEIRKHLEGKMELLNMAELEKDRVAMRNNSARALIQAYLKEKKLGSDLKDRLENVLRVLESGDRQGVSVLKSPANGLDTISEDGNGTTDLSMTQSEDDLDLSVRRGGRRRSKRPSVTKEEMLVKRRRHGSGKTDFNNTEQLIAKTVVSFQNNGPVHAVATLEAIPATSTKTTSSGYLKPSAPPMPTSESESDAVGGWVAVDKGRSSPAVLGENRHVSNQQISNVATHSPRFGRTLSSGGPLTMRQHAFCQKTVIKPETCEPCGKRIKFSKMAYKCRDCKATCHPECKDKVPIPCVSTGTPVNNNKNHMGYLADYVPSEHPLVPALIQHCVNEIEIRGLDTVGLYRVPGPEREVKELKEKFLRQKGVPNLSRYDIHSICGCVKDFLRSIQEPIIGRWFWNDFALAAEINDPIKRQQEIERIINDLAMPNQDTLGFMILHLQRVAESTEVKMPIGNLAKVFGPTIVGYSDPELPANEMLKETKKQQMVLETMLNIPADFWRKFVYRNDGKIYTSNAGGSYNKAKARTLQSPYTPNNPRSITSVDRVRNNGKKIYFTDDSPKEGIKTRSQKRTFFD